MHFFSSSSFSFNVLHERYIKSTCIERCHWCSAVLWAALVIFVVVIVVIIVSTLYYVNCWASINTHRYIFVVVEESEPNQTESLKWYTYIINLDRFLININVILCFVFIHILLWLLLYYVGPLERASYMVWCLMYCICIGCIWREFP